MLLPESGKNLTICCTGVENGGPDIDSCGVIGVLSPDVAVHSVPPER